MYRYIGFCWNERSQSQEEFAKSALRRVPGSEFNESFHLPGMCVFTARSARGPNREYVLRNQGGIVVGNVFSKPERNGGYRVEPVDEFDDSESRRIVTSRGRCLIDEYWGRYAAFIRGEDTRSSWIFKDPTGNLPCLVCEIHGLRIFFSSVSDFTSLGILKPTVSSRYIQTRLANGWSRGALSGLNEVQSLAGGECMELSDGVSRRRPYWNPVAMSEGASVEGADEAAVSLRAVTKACIHAWAGRYNSIVHSLSGGLDSSIVLAFLNNAPGAPQLTGFTHYAVDGSSDERYWARLAASHVGCELVEQGRAAEESLEGLAKAYPSESPGDYIRWLSVDLGERRMSANRAADAIFSGEGGDNVFGRNCEEFAGSEWALRKGIGPRLLSISETVASLKNTTVWHELRRALRSKVAGYVVTDVQKEMFDARRLLHPDVANQGLIGGRSEHPWFTDVEHIPWSVLLRVGELVECRMFYDPFRAASAPEPEGVAPLYSQPIVEAALRIPSYLFCHGARTRGLARMAFAKDIPAEIVRRETKDRGTRILLDIFYQNLPFIREFLLDGYLMSERLLLRNETEVCLSKAIARTPGNFIEILDYLCVESWLRASMPTTSRAAA